MKHLSAVAVILIGFAWFWVATTQTPRESAAQFFGAITGICIAAAGIAGWFVTLRSTRG